MMNREREDEQVETYVCECCESEYQVSEDDAYASDEYCEDCAYENALDAAADRRYRRAESGYPDA